MAKRRLVVCFDGTWNRPDKGDAVTNVVKLLRAIPAQAPDGTDQIVFYDKGVGTGNWWDRTLGGTFGIGLDENVIDGYRFIGNNYLPDDEIYIFGFSRGAYTARSLAGLVGMAGVLQPTSLGADLEAVLAIYRDKDVPIAERRPQVERMRLERFSEVPIRCVGVWDTVGALGIPGDLGRNFLPSRMDFHDVQLGPHVDVALHAIAIDEKRDEFPPTLWKRRQAEDLASQQHVEQVWFPGVHANIGGSYADSRLSDITLDWMVKRVEALTDLRFDVSYLRRVLRSEEHPIEACIHGKGVESRTALYLTSRLYPYQRLIRGLVPQASRVGDWVRARAPRWGRRNLPPPGMVTLQEAIHVSALQRWQLDGVQHDCPVERECVVGPYRPPNLAAAIRAAHQGDAVPVVGWDGMPLPSHAVPWPFV